MTEEDEDELLLREAIYGVCGRGRGQERRVEPAHCKFSWSLSLVSSLPFYYIRKLKRFVK